MNRRALLLVLLAAAQQAIMSMGVPAAYQKFHFKLLKILNSLESVGVDDLDYLSEQRTLLQAEYPWL